MAGNVTNSVSGGALGPSMGTSIIRNQDDQDAYNRAEAARLADRRAAEMAAAQQKAMAADQAS